MAITVKCHFDGGDSFTTQINATLEGARQYYLGKVFNVGLGPNDNMQKCISVELDQGEVCGG